jgi:hypothetical protein
VDWGQGLREEVSTLVMCAGGVENQALGLKIFILFYFTFSSVFARGNCKLNGLMLIG